MKPIALALASALWVMMPASAQDLVGVWQSSTQTSKRVVVITQAPEGSPAGGWRGVFYNAGADPRANPISTIRLDGRDVTFKLDYVTGAFTGTLAADSNSMTGTWVSPAGDQTLTFERATGSAIWELHPAPHKMQFVEVAKDVRLEVLDWGGKGPPLVFLAGLGNSAHVFDTLAPKFTGKHRVYGITRRGFGASSVPPPTDENYDVIRLADDVLSVIEALNITRPVLVGHSIAGQELSSIATRHPDKVAGLIYLDAAHRYAYFNPNSSGVDSADLHASDLRRLLTQLYVGRASPARVQSVAAEIVATAEKLKAGVQAYAEILDGLPEPTKILEPPPQTYVTTAILLNERKHGPVSLPTLSLAAVPTKCEPRCDTPGAELDAKNKAIQADAFAASSPTVRVVRLPFADHYLWNTHEAAVLREMNAFLSELDGR